LHFCLLGEIFAIKILTATKEFFLDVLFIFEFLTQGIFLAYINYQNIPGTVLKKSDKNIIFSVIP